MDFFSPTLYVNLIDLCAHLIHIEGKEPRANILSF